MSQEASIVLKLTDQTSAGFTAIRRAASETEKEFATLAAKVSDLQTKNKNLNSSYASLQAELVNAKKAVQDATKAFKENGDEAGKTNLKEAQEQYKTLTDQLNDFKAASSDTRKEIRQLQSEMRKLDEGSTGSGGSSSGSEALTGWSAMMSGLGRQAGAAVTSLASVALTSSLGSTDAGVVTSIISGIASGASVGLLSGNPYGVAIGAAVGGVSGLVEGIASVASSEDETFKSYRDELVSSAVEATAESLSGGTETAAGREQNSIAFGALIGEDRAESLLTRIIDLANETPYLYDDLTGIAKQLAIYDSTSGQIYQNLQRVGDFGATLGLTASDMAGLASVIGKIGDTEKYSSTYSRSLRNYGLNPAAVLASYLGIDNTAASSIITSGDLSGSTMVEAIWAYIDKNFAGMMEKQAGTYAGALSTNEGLQDEIDAAMGTAYTAARTGGLVTQNAWLQSAVMQDAFGIIGTANAQKENLEDEYTREILGGIFGDGTQELTVVDDATKDEIASLREQYTADLEAYGDANEQQQMEIGADVSSIYDQAQSLVTSAIDSAEAFDAFDDAENEIVTGVGQIVDVLNAYKDQWVLGKTQEKGMGTSSDYEVEWGSGADVGEVGSFLRSRAMGQHVIPYDNFPILAHEGEMLLTASEARSLQGGGVAVTGNTFIVRQESDIDAIAAALVEKIEAAAAIRA